MRFRSLPLILLLPLAANAAVVRGRVTTALGVPAPGARVQLIRLSGGARSVAGAIAGPDGSYELRTDLSGQFLLLTSPSLLAMHQAPQVGASFYAGRTDLVIRDVALDTVLITPQVSRLATLRETPLAELATEAAQVSANPLLTRAGITPELSLLPGAFVVQRGPTGSPAELYLRGAGPQTSKVELDGVSAEDLGGRFNLTTLGTTGLASMEPAPALELLAAALPLHLTDADAGLLGLHSAHAATIRPSLTYSGDAGPLATLRNELTLSATPRRADVFASASRFNTSNEQPAAPYHLITLATNLGYHISAPTSLRLRLRRDVSSAPLPVPLDLLGFQPAGKLAEQNLYGSFLFETETAGRWHNSVGYGLARKRAQTYAPDLPIIGRIVTVTGANGYTATGTATLSGLPSREDEVTDRDEFSVQSGRPVKPYLGVLLHLRYADERGADITPGQRLTAERHHLAGALGLSGQVRRRVFYELSGNVDHSPTLGYVGAPRLGLTYVPVEPGAHRFRGTVLHGALATGSREPSVLEQAAVPAVESPRSRMGEFGVEQTLLPGKLTLRATYYHSQFAHEFELVGPRVFSQTLAYRTQGLQSELRYQPSPRLSLRGGYGYLAALVEQSGATAAFNPAYPALRIGGLTALAEARPFHRPPNTGFAEAEYSGRLINASLKAAFAGRSDDSTNLPQTPTLLLPNRNLSPGYTQMDAAVTYAFSRRFTAYTQLTNLLDNRHIAPIGYTSTPFLIRTGLRIRLGGE